MGCSRLSGLLTLLFLVSACVPDTSDSTDNLEGNKIAVSAEKSSSSQLVDAEKDSLAANAGLNPREVGELSQTSAFPASTWSNLQNSRLRGELSMGADLGSGTRVALVIANNEYEFAGSLKNPKNDATIVSAVLEESGFKVFELIDGSRREISNSLNAFKAEAVGAQIAMIYFAGHGMGADATNWIIPTDARLDNEVDLYLDAIDMKALLLTLRDVDGLRIVILDACRDNPLSLKRAARASTRNVRSAGFAQIELEDLSASTIIMYSASKGETASDGAGKFSPFAAAFAYRFEERGKSINDILVDVRDDVLKETNGKQEPYLYGSPKKRFILRPLPEAATIAAYIDTNVTPATRVPPATADSIRGTWAYPQRSCERMNMTVDVASTASGDSLLLTFPGHPTIAEPVKLTDGSGAIHVDGNQSTTYQVSSDTLIVSTNGTEMKFSKCV